MRLAPKGTAPVASLAALLALTGCTLFPDQQPKTLAMTTSAERVNQIFWDEISSGKLESAESLLAPNVVWTTPDQTYRGKPAVSVYLDSAKAGATQVSSADLLSNGDSITVTYTLQHNANGAMRTERVASVWQHVPGKKANSPYLLTLLSVEPAR